MLRFHKEKMDRVLKTLGMKRRGEHGGAVGGGGLGETQPSVVEGISRTDSFDDGRLALTTAPDADGGRLPLDLCVISGAER